MKRFIVIAVFVLFMCASAPVIKAQDFGSVVDGVGVAGIKVGISTKDEIVGNFGSDYSVEEYGEYSTELFYEKKGMSFFFCKADPNYEVFVIVLKSPFLAVTSKGVVLGESSRQDVYRLYEGQELSAQSSLSDEDEESDLPHSLESDVDELPGIQFTYGTVKDRPGQQIVTAMDIVEESGLRQCDIKFGKIEDK